MKLNLKFVQDNNRDKRQHSELVGRDGSRVWKETGIQRILGNMGT